MSAFLSHARRVALVASSLLLVVPAAADARGADRDRDGMPDRWERKHHVAAAKKDRDRDGLTNAFEYRAKTNPRKRDTDRDGIRDGREDFDRDGLDNLAEAKAGTHPRKRDSGRGGAKRVEDCPLDEEIFDEEMSEDELMNGPDWPGEHEVDPSDLEEGDEYDEDEDEDEDESFEEAEEGC